MMRVALVLLVLCIPALCPRQRPIRASLPRTPAVVPRPEVTKDRNDLLQRSDGSEAQEGYPQRSLLDHLACRGTHWYQVPDEVVIKDPIRLASCRVDLLRARRGQDPLLRAGRRRVSYC